ncbi:MAG: hypothetical protein LUE26_05810 [Alistipes sp.]|nr:hypothetical protein [Alistipes sp.]
MNSFDNLTVSPLLGKGTDYLEPFYFCIMTEREKYKKVIGADKDYQELCKWVTDFTERNGLRGVMNDTKWLELQQAVRDELPFPPVFVVKRLGEEGEKHILEKDEYWYGAWRNYYDEGMPQLVTIEYIKVRPRLAVHRGRLNSPEIIDCTKEFLDILRRLNIPYVQDEHIITIYGYR